MFTIIRAAQEFEDPAWRTYDEAFREKTAATRNRKWSKIGTLIYNRIFIGHTKKFQMFSPSSSHNSSSIPSHNIPVIPPMPQGHYADPPPPKRSAPMQPTFSPPARTDICYLFNQGTCRYGTLCKFQHMCSVCSGRHPKVSCKAGKPPLPGLKDQGQSKPWSKLIYRTTYCCNCLTISFNHYQLMIMKLSYYSPCPHLPTYMTASSTS